MPNLRNMINDLNMKIYYYISKEREIKDMDQIEFD